MYFGNRDLAVLKDLCDCGVYGSTYPCGPSWGRGGGVAYFSNFQVVVVVGNMLLQ